MVGAKTGAATHINEIELHAHLTHCHGYSLQSAVCKAIKTIKIMRGTLDAAFELSKFLNFLWFKTHRKK